MPLMGVELLPVLGYALVSIFTPGPNNITSSSLGMRVGYPRTLRFIAGVVTGFFCIMVAAGLLTKLLVSAYDRIAIVLKIAGVTYLLWIAWTVVRPEDKEHVSATASGTKYRDGLLLQFVNPKVILVTGRELADLLEVFPRYQVCDRIVAENGALLYQPITNTQTVLAKGPPRSFVAR